MSTLLRFLPRLLLVTLGSASLHAATGRDLANQILLPDRLLARAEELQLTPAQREAIVREQTAQRSQLAESLGNTRRLTEALASQLQNTGADDASILARFDELTAAETQFKRERLLLTLRLRRLLTPDQLARIQSSPAATTPARPAPADRIPPVEFSRSSTTSSARASIPQLLQQVRAGIETWRAAGRDLTEVNTLWARFRRHAEAREHPQARQALQDLAILLSAPADTPSASSASAPAPTPVKP